MGKRQTEEAKLALQSVLAWKRSIALTAGAIHKIPNGDPFLGVFAKAFEKYDRINAEKAEDLMEMMRSGEYHASFAAKRALAGAAKVLSDTDDIINAALEMLPEQTKVITEDYEQE